MNICWEREEGSHIEAFASHFSRRTAKWADSALTLRFLPGPATLLSACLGPPAGCPPPRSLLTPAPVLHLRSQRPGLLSPSLDHTPMPGTHETVTPVTHAVSQLPQGRVSTMARLNERVKTSLPSLGRRKSQNRPSCWLAGRG